VPWGSKRLKKVLEAIERKFKGTKELFKAQPHIPKDPKTNLPMMTYYMGVPSACTERNYSGKRLPVLRKSK